MRKVLMFFAGNERGGAAAHITTLARTIVKYGKRDRFLFVSLGNGPLASSVAETGIPLRVISSGTVGALRELSNMIRGERVLLHSHGPRLNILAAFVANQAHVPWTSTIHSHPSYDFLGSRVKSWVYPRLHLWSLRQAIGLFIVEPSLEQALPTKTVLDVPNALDVRPRNEPREKFASLWRERLGLASKTRLIGIAARFHPVKNIDILIRAASRLQTQDTHLLIAGDGELRSSLEALTQELGLVDKVHFLGFLTDMYEFYNAIDIHILPSKSEGTPFCVLEAGAYGAANIASDIPSLRDLLQGGRAGELVPVGDVDSTARAIDQLLQGENDRRQFVQTFQSNVLPKFMPEKMLAAYERGYTVLEEDILRSRHYNDPRIRNG
ncbi:glycosyltransferase [Alicyclobacillus dauci]|uniref:Glycosyltransferase n=1 Tax=Alicyclobacillus dauci TaxID=1475485 RepID=A0ABY6Z5P3_9BACL|nr:glycosyltransferase [Alicyclobacillus dauci]WAH38202.1 glycosyltransferase [Alicyclobacillus dauci]